MDLRALGLEIGLASVAVASLIPATRRSSMNPAVSTAIGFAVLVLLPLGLHSMGWFGPSLNYSNDILAIDAFGFFFKCLFLASGLLTLTIAKPWLKSSRQASLFVSVLLIALAGMALSASAQDLIVALLTAELVAMCMYILPALFIEKKVNVEAAIKYLVLNGIATGLSLAGLALVLANTGSAHYVDLRSSLISPQTDIQIVAGILLFSAAIAFKLAIVPFQFWAADVYQSAPLPVVMLLATGSKLTGLALITRLLATCPTTPSPEIAKIISLLSVLTIVYGSLSACVQINYRRMIGYSSVANAGLMLACLVPSLTTPENGTSSIANAIYYGTAYALGVAAALLGPPHELAKLPPSTNETHTPQPADNLTPIVGLISLAGIPPTAGFFAKFLLIKELLNSTRLDSALLPLLMASIAGIIVSVYFYLRAAGTLLNPELKKKYSFREHGLNGLLLWKVFLSSALLLGGILHKPLLQFFTEVARQLTTHSILTS